MSTSRARATSPWAIAAFVVALLALLASASGAAYAAGLAKNSVGTAQLKKNAVTTSKVKNHSLRAVDFAAGQIPAGATGPRGPSDVYESAVEGFTADGQALAFHLDLPAGTYYVTARVDGYSGSTTKNGWCQLSSTGTGNDFAWIAVPGGTEASGSLQAGITLPTAGKVTLDCAAVSGLAWGRQTIDALAITTLHQ